MAKTFKIVAIALGVLLLLSACGDPFGERYVGFAECLTEKGVTMYGAYWCPHCSRQKKLFGKTAFKKVDYVECDARGEGGNPELCLAKKIPGYPTWDFADGSREIRVMALQELSTKTDCPLPSENP